MSESEEDSVDIGGVGDEENDGINDAEENGEAEVEEVKPKPLTKEIAGESLSLLCKTGRGLSHAFVRMNLKDNGLTDISILSRYIHVRYVDISGNNLDDISSVGALPDLLVLNANHNKLISAHLPVLKYLQVASFSHNSISSTDGIDQPMLELLDLSFNQITEVAGLQSKNLPILRVLDLHSNHLQSTEGINLHTLRKLYLASNKLTNCEGIQGLCQLTDLHLRENNVSSLDGFAPSLGALQYVNLRGNPLQDLSELNKLKCLPLLRALALSDTPLMELDDYRIEVCSLLRQLERLDKDEFTEDDRADAEELHERRQQGSPEN